MRTAPPPALALALSLALAACGGDSEKEGLRSYEAAVEDLMAEDGGVSARLTDLREDLRTANAGSRDQSTFGREQGLPFYRRFRKAASDLEPGSPRLGKVHGVLLEYLGHRIAYLESIDEFLAAREGEAIRALQEKQGPWTAARKALFDATGGRIPDAEAQDAVTTGMLFMERVYGPFQRGQAGASSVEEALRQEVLPRLARLSDRLRDSLAAEGATGAIARWARAESEFFQSLAACLPQQEGLQRIGLRAKEEWDRSEERRQRFLDDLRSYRESLR